MSLRTADLNLLPILRALLREGSVTKAAAALGLSQPATSNALGRLRHLLGDELLVKVGRTMRPTPRAERLRPMLEGACTTIEMLLADAEFDPRTARREFVIATPDYMALFLAPFLMKILDETAPGVTLRFVDIGAGFRDQLAPGQLDVAIVANPEKFTRELSVQAGYMDRRVGVVAADHPLAGRRRVTADQLRAWPLLGIYIWPAGGGGGQAADETWLAQPAGPVTLSVSHLLVLPFLAAQTRGFAMVPETLAAHVAKLAPITQFDLPGPPTPIDVCLVWSPVVDSEPAHLWLRQTLDLALRAHFQRREPGGGQPVLS